MAEPITEMDADLTVLMRDVSVDKKVAEFAGRRMMLQRNNTLRIDAIGDMTRGADLHVFSADYDVFVLPKHQ